MSSYTHTHTRTIHTQYPSARLAEARRFFCNKGCVPDLAFRRFRTFEGVLSISGVGRAVLLLELVIRLFAPRFNFILSLGCSFRGDGTGSSSSSSSSYKGKS